MRCAGVAPAACLQRLLTLLLMAWRLALLGVICSWARVPLRRACVHQVCPQKSTPCARGVLTVFVADSRPPRSANKAVIRGRMVSSKTCRALAVTMQSSAHRPELLWWTRRCQLLPCTTAARPSSPLWLIPGEIIPPCGTPVVVGHRAPRSPQPLLSPCDSTRLCIGMGFTSHAKAMWSTKPAMSSAKIQVAEVCCRQTFKQWSMASAYRRLGRNPYECGSAVVAALGWSAWR